MDPSGSRTDAARRSTSLHDTMPHTGPLSTPHGITATADSQSQCRTLAPARGCRKVILHFTPSWFSVTMGTGIVSVLLHNFPYNARWLYWLSVVMFGLNVLLFVLFTIISVLRYTMFKGILGEMIRHPAQSLFLGTIPMGLATIINMIAGVCVPAWGDWAAYLAWGLWWFDVALSVACCVFLPFVLITLHEARLDTMTAAWLLPVVSTIVASATGGVVADVLPNDQYALWTMVVSYVLWGTGVPLALTILVIYFQRLAVHHLPPREVIVSVFLPLGPLGQGGFGAMKLGAVARKLLPRTGNLLAGISGDAFYSLGFLVALVLFGYGLVWLFFAFATIARSKRHGGFPFNMGWWGFTFPMGVFAMSTITIGEELPSGFFKVLGSIFAVTVMMLWIVVAMGTVKGAWSGQLIYAPCVPKWEKKMAQQSSSEKLVANTSEA